MARIQEIALTGYSTFGSAVLVAGLSTIAVAIHFDSEGGTKAPHLLDDLEIGFSLAAFWASVAILC